jgi:hypothetical protein
VCLAKKNIDGVKKFFFRKCLKQKARTKTNWKKFKASWNFEKPISIKVKPIGIL